VEQSKRVEVRIVKLSPYGSPLPLVFVEYVSSKNFDEFALSGASNKGGVGKTSYLLALSVNISKTVTDTIND